MPPTTDVDPIIYKAFKRPEWHEQATCYQQGYTDYFYEGKAGAKAKRERAKEACNHPCPVKSICLTAALTRREKYGIWGGLTPDEREELLRKIDKGEITIAEAVLEAHDG